MTQVRTLAVSTAPVARVAASAYKIPTDAPESDGTLEWSSTTMVLAEVTACGATGIGYTYGNDAIARLIEGPISEALNGADALATSGCWLAMVGRLRNQGRPGLTSMAVAAVDAALWDLKGHLLGAPVVQLLGAARPWVEMYGSGGFTSYSDEQLRGQLGRWTAEGHRAVKMKVGRDPARDPHRLQVARAAIGDEVRLMIDANGAFDRKRAVAFADMAAGYGVTWFEEPVTSDDLPGLRLVRDRAPAPMAVAAGEYGYDTRYFEQMLSAGAVDVLQADATRCGGITGFMAADALCQAHCIDLSAHCGPSLHCHPACAAKRCINVEGFHDHVRIESMLFDGAPVPNGGRLAPDLGRPGLGLEFKRADAARFAL